MNRDDNDGFTYLTLAQEPPGKKLGHYKLRRPIVEQLDEQLLPTEHLTKAVERLAALVANDILHGTKK